MIATAANQLDSFLIQVNNERRAYWEYNFNHNPYTNLRYKFGKKYAKIFDGPTIWAFVALEDNPKKGYVAGDLLRPASFKTPAKHARGNILQGTSVYGYWGPDYL